MNKRRSSLAPNFWILLLPVMLFGAVTGHAQNVDGAWKDLMVQGQHAAVGKDYVRAEQVYQRALKEAERFGPADSRVASTLRSLGSVYQALRRSADAAAAYNRA